MSTPMKLPKPTEDDRARFCTSVPDHAGVEAKPIFGNLPPAVGISDHGRGGGRGRVRRPTYVHRSSEGTLTGGSEADHVVFGQPGCSVATTRFGHHPGRTG
jgi:hypothetical protein